MKILDGSKIAEEKLLALKEKIKESKLSLSIGVVQVGKNKVSEVYIREKRKKMEKVGIGFQLYRLKEESSEESIIEKINSLKEDGIIVQLPLPSGMEKRKLLEAVPLSKDVDLLSGEACGAFYNGFFNIFPPVVGAVDTLLEDARVTPEGKDVVLVGAGGLVGKPLAVYFMEKGATVSILNAKTDNPQEYMKKGDIVVSGAGVPGLVKGEMIKEGAILIDAGTSVDEGKLKGDIDRKSVEKKASFLAPVPGGVGPLTTYHLAYNLFYLKKYGR